MKQSSWVQKRAGNRSGVLPALCICILCACIFVKRSTWNIDEFIFLFENFHRRPGLHAVLPGKSFSIQISACSKQLFDANNIVGLSGCSGYPKMELELFRQFYRQILYFWKSYDMMQENCVIFMEAGMILETERLYLREMDRTDFCSLCKILQDEEVMYAYEGAFSDQEVQEWLDRQIARYRQWGYGLWAAVLKETDDMIGQCGLTMQPWKEQEVLEVGYLFRKLYWHKGYATEAAKACIQYAFEVLHAQEVCSIIRDTNIASQNVAIRNGLTMEDTWVKHYRGIDMPHVRYVIRR